MSLSAFQTAMLKKKKDRENAQIPKETSREEPTASRPQSPPTSPPSLLQKGPAKGQASGGLRPIRGLSKPIHQSGDGGSPLSGGNASGSPENARRNGPEAGGRENPVPAASLPSSGPESTAPSPARTPTLGRSAASATTQTTAPAKTPQASQPSTVRKIGIAGLKPLGVITPAPDTHGSAHPDASGTGPAKAGVVSAPPAAKPPSIPNAAPTSALGKLMARANPSASSASALPDPAYDSDISLEASHVFEHGTVYRVEELLEDWPATEHDTEDYADELQQTRNELVARAVARLNNIFSSHLEELKTGVATHPICTELSQITKLTFMRVKDSPAAWDALDPDDHAVIVRGLRVMAEKRKAATTGAKNKKVASKELEAASQFDDLFADLGLTSFDLGF